MSTGIKCINSMFLSSFSTRKFMIVSWDSPRAGTAYQYLVRWMGEVDRSSDGESTVNDSLANTNSPHFTRLLEGLLQGELYTVTVVSQTADGNHNSSNKNKTLQLGQYKISVHLFDL